MFSFGCFEINLLLLSILFAARIVGLLKLSIYKSDIYDLFLTLKGVAFIGELN